MMRASINTSAKTNVKSCVIVNTKKNNHEVNDQNKQTSHRLGYPGQGETFDLIRRLKDGLPTEKLGATITMKMGSHRRQLNKLTNGNRIILQAV